MEAGGAGAQGGRRGRVPGVPNRDKAELRALLQEKVHEFTELRQQIDLQNLAQTVDGELSPALIEKAKADGLIQAIVEDYDPVVAMAITSVDRRVPLEMRTKCNAEVAQYVRPKLKSVEVTTDPEALETLEERRQLSEKLVGLLEAAASVTKPERPRPAAPPEEKPQ